MKQIHWHWVEISFSKYCNIITKTLSSLQIEIYIQCLLLCVAACILCILFTKTNEIKYCTFMSALSDCGQ